MTFPPRLLLLALLPLLLGAFPAAAQTITRVAVLGRGAEGSSTNLIAADQVDGSGLTNRHRILLEADLSIPSAGRYRLRYQLIDEQGVIVVSDTQDLGSIPAGNRTDSWELASFPSRLDPHRKHRLRVRVDEGLPTGPPLNSFFFNERHSMTEATGRTYYHFPGTTSADAPLNVIARVTQAGWGARRWLLDTQSGREHIVATCDYELRRYDGWAAGSAPTDNISVTIEAELRRVSDDALIPVTVAGSPANFVTLPITVSTNGWVNPVLIREPTVTTGIHANIQLNPAQQLDSKNQQYYVRTRIRHVEEAGQPEVPGNEAGSAGAQLFHFNGNLLFGGILTTFGSAASVTVVNSTGPTLDITIDQQSGRIAGQPGHTFGNGSAQRVLLEPDGDAVRLAPSTVAVAGPANDTGSMGNVSFTRSSLVLTEQGVEGTLTVRLPHGCGYSTAPAAAMLDSTYAVHSVPLGQSLLPTSSVVWSPASPVYVHEETKPILYQTSSLTWHATQGKFDLGGPVAMHSVHRPYIEALESIGAVPVLQRTKPSNDGYWRHVNGSVGVVTIQAGPTGAARIDAPDIAITANKFFHAHHPKMAVVSWSQAGSITLSADQPVPGSSKLNGMNAVVVPYAQSCQDTLAACPGAAEVFATYVMNPSGGALVVLPNGGLHAAGTIQGVHKLGWGRMNAGSPLVHEAQTPFANAKVMIGGHFLREHTAAAAGSTGPGHIFNTGVNTSNQATLEAPDTTEYRAGLGDYPGVNLRASGGDAGRQMISRLGGQATAAYTLATNSKFYARWSGVSGIQQATGGVSLPNPSLFGFPAQLQTFGLSWLSNENLISRTDGELHIVAPANVTLPFDDLTFTCLGAPSAAGMSGGAVDRTLAYWNAPTRIFGLDFVPADSCDPSAGCLALACSLSAQNVPVPLVGTLGFRPDGQITAPGQPGNCGIASEFVLPAVTHVQGPRRTAAESAQTYAFTPVRLAYLNTESEDNRPAGPERVGFWNLAGTLDVPFFQNMQVHGHTSANPTAPTAELHLTGGFAAAGKSFFTDSDFDSAHAGRPAALTVASYRGSSAHRAHARQLWLGMFSLDYPLAWSSARRSFRGSEAAGVNLHVLSVQSQVGYLDPGHAELSFGVQYEGLPRINASNAFFNAVDEQTGVASSIVNAVGKQVFDHIEGGVDSFADLLSDQADRFIGEVVDDLIEPGLDNFVDVVKQTAAAAVSTQQDVRTAVKGKVDVYLRPMGASPPPPGGGGAAPPPPPVMPLQNTLAGFVGTLGSPTGLVPSIDLKLGSIQTGAFAIAGTAGEPGNPLPGGVAGLLGRTSLADVSPRNHAEALITGLVGSLAPQFQQTIQSVNMHGYLEDSNAALDQIKLSLDQIRASVQSLRGSLANGQQFLAELASFQLQLDLLLADASPNALLNTLADAVQAQIDEAFDRLEENFPAEADVEAYVEGLRDQIKARIRRELRDRLMASAAIESMRGAVRDRLQVVHLAFREAVDSGFEEINLVIRRALSAQLAQLDNSLNSHGAEINKVIKSGRVAGHAHIQDDALRELRLDARIELGVPEEDPFRFDGFFRFQQLNSAGPGGCPELGASLDAARFVEVTLGARNASLEWITPDMRANVSGQIGFMVDGAPIPISIGGSFEMTEGALNFATAEVEELRGTLKVGLAPGSGGGVQLGENYLGLAGAVRLSGSGLEGGLFVGRSCTLDPINLINPQLGDLLGSGGFTGGYVFGAGRIPIVDFGCLFNVSAGVGLGAFYSVPGPTWGGLAQLSASGEALCLISVRGSVDLIGLKRGDEFRFSGQGRISGKVGLCPFCKRFRKTVRFTYQGGDWDADY